MIIRGPQIPNPHGAVSSYLIAHHMDHNPRNEHPAKQYHRCSNGSDFSALKAGNYCNVAS